LDLKFLIDTHVILWLLDDYSNLSKFAQESILDTKSSIFVSKVSLFEISIKKNISKLNIQYSINGILNELKNQNIEILEIEQKHLDYYINLPVFENHKDPFDRLLIATAATENLTLISIDEKFKNYQNLVQTIW
jgi:PIN domain nuclease of toxin-antitoxin system